MDYYGGGYFVMRIKLDKYSLEDLFGSGFTIANFSRKAFSFWGNHNSINKTDEQYDVGDTSKNLSELFFGEMGWGIAEFIDAFIKNDTLTVLIDTTSINCTFKVFESIVKNVCRMYHDIDMSMNAQEDYGHGLICYAITIKDNKAKVLSVAEHDWWMTTENIENGLKYRELMRKRSSLRPYIENAIHTMEHSSDALDALEWRVDKDEQSKDFHEKINYLLTGRINEDKITSRYTRNDLNTLRLVQMPRDVFEYDFN